MTTTTTTAESEAFLAAVKEQLSDLPEEERTDLLEDLAQHLADISADRAEDGPLRSSPRSLLSHGWAGRPRCGCRKNSGATPTSRRCGSSCRSCARPGGSCGVTWSSPSRRWLPWAGDQHLPLRLGRDAAEGRVALRPGRQAASERDAALVGRPLRACGQLPPCRRRGWCGARVPQELPADRRQRCLVLQHRGLHAPGSDSLFPCDTGEPSGNRCARPGGAARFAGVRFSRSGRSTGAGRSSRSGRSLRQGEARKKAPPEGGALFIETIG